MPRFLGPLAFCAVVLSALSAVAQTTASTTTVTATPASAPYGTAISIGTGVSPAGSPATLSTGAVALPTGTVQFLDGSTALDAPVALTAAAGFTLEPFASVFGNVDPSLSNGFYSLVSDWNGDGAQDLLLYAFKTGGVNGSFQVQSFSAKSGSGFTAATAQNLVLPAGVAPNLTPLAVDENGDGKLDLLLGTSVAYGNGDGTFQQPVVPSFLTTGYTYTYVADVNGDGKADVIALNAVPPQMGNGNQAVSLQVTVFANQGSGNFQSLGTFTLSSFAYCPCIETSVASLSFVDLNGDGKLDIVAQSYLVPDGQGGEPAILTTLLNNGDGTFAPAVTVAYTDTVPSDAGALTLQAADFNGDGKIDLVLSFPPQMLSTSLYKTIVDFLPGNGDGTFGSEIDSSISTPASQTTASTQLPTGNAVTTDVNLDGLPDLAFGSGFVVQGDGKGDFAAGSVIEAGSGSISLILLAGNSLPSYVFGASFSTPFQVPAVATHNVSSTAAPAPVTLAAGAHSITAKYSGDSNYAASTSAATVVNIAQVVTTTTLTSTANPAYRGETATITVAVRSSGGLPTGTVSFTCNDSPMSGLNCPGTLPLDAQGNASFQASNTGPLDGSLVMTVTYSGDANHASSTVQYTQGFLDPVNIASSASGAGTITVKSGQSASTQLSVSGNAGFTGAANLVCSGLPTNASCVFNPAITSLTATAQTVTLTISTSGSTSASLQPLFGEGLQTLACGFFAGGLLLVFPRRRWTHWIGIAIIGLGLLPLGCGGNHSSSSGGSSSNVAPGTYPFTISGNGGGQESGAQFELIVQ